MYQDGLKNIKKAPRSGLFFRTLTPLPMAVYTYFNKIFENLSILTDEIRIYK